MKKKYTNFIKKVDPWLAENAFYLNASPERISKFMCHYEVFNKIKNLRGDIVECGVFRGSSFSRFMCFDKIFNTKKRFYGLDVFGKFPNSGTKQDRTVSKNHNKIGYGIKKDDLEFLLRKRNLKNFNLIKGDVLETLKIFLNGKKKICLLHLDLDVYEATKYVLENLLSSVVKNGIILIDDYKHIHNTTKAVDEFLIKNKKLKINKFSFPCRPSFIVKKY